MINSPSHTPSRAILGRSCAALLALGSLLLTPLAHAGDLTKELSKPIITPEAPASRIHALIVNEFSDHYITPRGLDVENQGLIWQPLGLVFLNLYQAKSGWLTDVTASGGVWNSVHTRASGAVPSVHNELDGIGGLGFKFFNQVALDVTWTCFESETESYETSQNLSIKLTWNDKIFGERFSINPYVEFWKELENKDTVLFNPLTSEESFYFCLGINPTYKFEKLPLELSLPTFVNFCDSDFYQRFDGSPGGGGFALVSTELKATVPLKFIPKEYGFWSIYAGVQYYYLDNAGLLDGNQALNATSERLHNLVQFHGGLSVFF